MANVATVNITNGRKRLPAPSTGPDASTDINNGAPKPM
jgi:hypothetical protein